jgi:hypothetical protein
MGVAFATGTGPIWLTAAALIAMALIVESLVQYFENGAEASMIGKWFEDTFGMKGPEAVKQLKMSLLAIAGVLTLLLIPFAPITALILAIAFLAVTLIEYWDQIPGAFGNMINEVITFFKYLFGWLILSIYKVFEDFATAIAEGAAELWFPVLDAWETVKALVKSSVDDFAAYVFAKIASIMNKMDLIPAALRMVPGFGAALSAGGSVAKFIGGGAVNPTIDANKRLNQISNNSRSSSNTISAPITVQVDGSAGGPGMISELESKLSGIVDNLFRRAADDLDGAAQ